MSLVIPTTVSGYYGSLTCTGIEELGTMMFYTERKRKKKGEKGTSCSPAGRSQAVTIRINGKKSEN